MNPDQVQDSTNWLMNCGAVPFTVAACIIIGYAFRLIPIFPNKWIPTVCIVIGSILFPLLNPKPSSETSVAFYSHAIVGGIFLGLVAWLLHDKFISKNENKIPVLGKVLTVTDKS